jgi:hypothetical protein
MTAASELADVVCAILHGDVIVAAMPCMGSDTISIHSMRTRTNGRM